MNIIIPIGGLGERFKKDNYSMPKPLVNVLGQPLIMWVLNCLNITKEDHIFIVYNHILSDYNFEDIINFKFKHKNISFKKLNFDTRGAAETILCGLNSFNIEKLDDLTLCIDCDTFYKEDIISTVKKVNDNTIIYFEDYQEAPIYSYIETDNNKVVAIKEKVKISNKANVGAYCFKSARILKVYCEKLLNSPLTDKREYYVSNIYDLMLKDNIGVYAEKISDFSCLGTPEQLKTFCFNKVGTPKRFCFDLDNTLVTYPLNEGDYTSVKPIIKNINYLKFLKEQGHTIIIHTARRMKTHKGNVGGVIADIGKITIDTIEKFGIPYDELYFGKPYADFYIDDLSVTPYQSLEKQCGFYNTNINCRSFNKITIKPETIIKTSDNKEQIAGEIYWYKNIPDQIKEYFPKLIKATEDSLEIEKIKSVPISHLFANYVLTDSNLVDVLTALSKIHRITSSNEKIDIYANYSKKLKDRYASYNYGVFKNSKDVYEKILKNLEIYEGGKCGVCAVIHGDPVFTNILINQDNKIKFIDMRGRLGNSFTIYGDIFYDLGKVYQSLIGYDFVLHSVKKNKDYCDKLEKVFFEFVSSEYGKDAMGYIINITNSLLFSLLPLHDNEKCIEYYNLIRI